MTSYPIVLESISKKYTLYPTNSHRLREILHPFRKKYHAEYWALNNVSLKIAKGETVGILGVNGSGKSTLLQIICSILQPTTGNITVKGKIAALIELGAGFNPEMTGRENAEVNLVIMGVPKSNLEDAVNEVERFAELNDFFDQPVKTYSSGMFMRLAFATAITVDPDILVIDEALAVGDARFQQKCFQKFHDFQKAGKTILFVTHDRFAIPRLCTSAILMHKGELVSQGDPKEIVDQYSQLLFASSHTEPDKIKDENISTKVTEAVSIINDFDFSTVSDQCHINPTFNKNEKRFTTGDASIINYVIQDGTTTNPQTITSASKVNILFSILFNKDVDNPIVGYTVKSKDGIVVYSIHSGLLGQSLQAKRAGEIGIYCFETELMLSTGDWFIDLAVANSTESLLDSREGMIYLYVNSEIAAVGLANFKTNIIEKKAA